MKLETANRFQSAVPFTIEILEQLKKEGFKYVQVKAYTQDKQLDYINMHYLLLIPTKTASTNGCDMEIYELIQSKILITWAEDKVGAKVLVSFE